MEYLKVTLITSLLLLVPGLESRSGPAAAVNQESGREKPEPHVIFKLVFGGKVSLKERWTGTIHLDEIQVTETKGLRFRPSDHLSLNTFDLSTWLERGDRADRPKEILVRGRGRARAKIRVETSQGSFNFRLQDLAPGSVLDFLDEKVQVSGLQEAQKVTNDSQDDDFPSIVMEDDRHGWMVWQSYTGESDEVRLSRYEGRWKAYARVPGASGDVWRPQVALDASRRPWVVWSQQIDGNFDIYARALNHRENEWGENEWDDLVRLSSHPNPDINASLVSDAEGGLWVVWQGFRGDNSDIFLRHYDGEQWSGEIQVTGDPANDWDPQVAVNSQGFAQVVWDSYRNGNYDVYLRSVRGETLGPEVLVAGTPRFEAHATVAVDGEDRIWVAWDEGGVNWGKDTGATEDPGWLENAEETFKKFWAKPTPGTGLYDGRELKLVVLEGSRRMSPIADLGVALSSQDLRQHDYPRLLSDPRSGRIGLLFHSWDVMGQWSWSTKEKEQVYWEQALIFYEGSKWSKVVVFPESRGRLTMFSDATFAPDGSLWSVWPDDGREFASPYQPLVGNIYGARLEGSTDRRTLKLTDWREPDPDSVTVVHPHEKQDIEVIRSYRTFIHGAEHRIVRGEFHRHTEFSWDNGGLRDGSLVDFYRYVLDAAALDFGAVTDHNSGGDYKYWWWLIEKSCDMYQIPRAFNTFYAYERSVSYPGGHRNVFHTRRGVPVVSFFTETAFQRPRPGVAASPAWLVENDTRLLYESLHETGGISIPHTTGTAHGGTDWSDNDPDVEPVVEIFQGARVSFEHVGAPRAARTAEDFSDFREPGFVWEAYKKGYRIGTIASSDHWSTHISFAMVYTEEPTREAIFDAIKKRRTYGATDNIILEVRMGEHFMGEEFETRKVIPLMIRVVGTSAMSKVEVIKNEEIVYSTRPGEREVALTFLDQDVSLGTSYYYVRALQDDWEIAWGSPIWVTYLE